MNRHARLGFTLVELLVVIGAITLLAGLLVPAIGMARRSSNATASQSNLKQWAAATINYSDVNKNRLPWEGAPGNGTSATSSMEANLLERSFWANALAPLVGVTPYNKLVDQSAPTVESLPAPKSRSVWIDPGAEPDPSAPWEFAVGKTFYFNYVPNCRLNDGIVASAPPGTLPISQQVISMPQISNASSTVLMMETRSRAKELSAVDPYFGAALDVCNGDWHVFPNRYFDGGHIAFVDGHVALVLTDVATRSIQGLRDPGQPGGDWNYPSKLIWNPSGVAGDVPPSVAW